MTSIVWTYPCRQNRRDFGDLLKKRRKIAIDPLLHIGIVDRTQTNRDFDRRNDI